VTPVLYAVRPNEGLFHLSPTGTTGVLDDRCTKFTPSSPGKRRYPILNPAQKERIVKIYREVVGANQAGSASALFDIGRRKEAEEKQEMEKEKERLEQEKQPRNEPTLTSSNQTSAIGVSFGKVRVTPILNYLEAHPQSKLHEAALVMVPASSRRT
jgi:hypothetical protein